jgi:tRNA(Ile)-lysidine synthase
VQTYQSAQWQCGAYSLYRFKGELIAVRQDNFEPQVMSKKYAPSVDEIRIELPGNGILILLSGSETIVSDSHVSVRYRQGGERLSLPGRPSKSLKKTLNEESVAPWLRDRLPLVFLDDELLWVALLGLTAEAAKYTEVNASGQGLGMTFEWLPPGLELSREANSRW